jgi:hypothetical protein
MGSRQEIDSGGNPKHKRAEDKIGREMFMTRIPTHIPRQERAEESVQLSSVKLYCAKLLRRQGRPPRLRNKLYYQRMVAKVIDIRRAGS